MLESLNQRSPTQDWTEPSNQEKDRRNEKMTVGKKIVCHACNLDMVPEILIVHFPKGGLPARGYRCPKCRDELVPLDEAQRVEAIAEKVGLFGAVNPLTKNITQCGNSLAIYIPKDFEKQLNLKKGEKVQVWLQDDEIVVKPV